MDRQLHGEDTTFKSSNGWLSRFKNRHGIAQCAIVGEIRSADVEGAEAFIPTLRNYLDEHNLTGEQIYNADETGLYFKMLPDKTLAVKKDVHKTEGFKTLKNRVTVLLGTNRTGQHKLKPLVIGMFKNPRCFHHVNRDTLPVTYAASKSAWMTADIFKDWFFKYFVPAVRRHLTSLGMEKKAVLLLDNCRAHPPASVLQTRDGLIKVLYLPPNTTSKIQPMDMGIISNMKQNYRRELVRDMIDSDDNVTDYLKRINIKDMIYLLHKAWDGVTQLSVKNCWTKGLGAAFGSAEPFEGFTAEDIETAEQRLDEREPFEGFTDEDIDTAQQKFDELYGARVDMNSVMGEWVEVDQDCPVVDPPTDNQLLIEACGPGLTSREAPPLDSEDDTEDMEDTDTTPAPTAAEALSGLETGLRWLETCDVDLVKVLQLKGLINMARKKQKSSLKQQKLTDFFNM